MVGELKPKEVINGSIPQYLQFLKENINEMSELKR